jgi:hypothetical protein
MAGIQDYNLMSVVEGELLRTLKSSLYDNLLHKLVEEFKATAEVEVRKEVDKLTVHGVATMRDLAKMRDEVHVYCTWEGDNGTTTSTTNKGR